MTIGFANFVALGLFSDYFSLEHHERIRKMNKTIAPATTRLWSWSS